MCGHAFMFRHRDDLQRHRPRWQCGTCGRVSSVPLDCCTRPDCAPHHSPQLTLLLSQWMRTCGRWTLARVRLLWGVAAPLCHQGWRDPGHGEPAQDMITGGVMLPLLIMMRARRETT